MTLHSKIWAIGTLVLFLPLGLYVMAGYIPGAHSDHDALRGLAILTSASVSEHGAIFTGLGIMVFGLCLASVFLVWGDYLRRSDGNGGGDFGGCGDGGD